MTAFSGGRLTRIAACAVIGASVAFAAPTPANAATRYCDLPGELRCRWVQDNSLYPQPYDSGGKDARHSMYVDQELAYMAVFHAYDEVVVLYDMRRDGEPAEVRVQYQSPAGNWHEWNYKTGSSPSRVIELGDGNLAEGQPVTIKVGFAGNWDNGFAAGVT